MTFLITLCYIMNVIFHFFWTQRYLMSQNACLFLPPGRREGPVIQCCSVSMSRPNFLITSAVLYIRYASMPSGKTKFYVSDRVKLVPFPLLPYSYK
jgi:hypothetical protein